MREGSSDKHCNERRSERRDERAATWRHLDRAVRSAVVLGVMATVACGPRKPQEPTAVVVEGRFPHDLHKEQTCQACHETADVLSGQFALPGKSDHAPCDESGCHREQFLGVASKLCDVCHDEVDVSGTGTTLSAYPPKSGPRQMASEFDHALHLNFAKMEESVGFHVSCSDCHVDGEGAIGSAGHRACSRCHAPEAAPPRAPSLAECERCHTPRKDSPTRSRQLIVGDLFFGHQSHRVDRKGTQIRCVECHTQSQTYSGVGNHPRPETASCVTCHDDSARVPSGRRMRICETCHAQKRAQVGSIAPRSHLPATERPLDHTLAFRRDHGDDASRDATRCARCHTVLSGSSRDVCDECHGVMRPHDHTVTWREYDHGQEAATESERCSICHSGDFCTTCHSLVPRSHFPLIEYRAGGHSAPAMINPRACVTCHPQTTFCSQPGCHTTGR